MAGTARNGRQPEPAPEIASLLVHNATVRPDGVALRSYRAGRWEQVTWREFAALAATAAVRSTAELPGAGPALVVIDNSIESLAAFAGLAVAGIDCALLEADSQLLHDAESAIHALGSDTVVGSLDAPPRYRVLPAPELTRPVPDGSPLIGPVGASPDRARPPGGDAGTAVWQCTSGSTGEPRPARQTVPNLVRGGLIYARRYQVTERDKLLATVPMAHSFGLVGGLMCALVSGAALTIFARYSPRGVREAIEAGATVALGTPLVYELLTRSPGPASSALRMALSSGGPLEPAVASTARQQLGCPVYQVYGSTETGAIASQFPRDRSWPPGCVGVAVAGAELRLGDPARGPESGAELQVRTATMFGGYLGDGQVFTPDGWYRTGDLAAIDQAGHLELVRRKDSFINVGGRKVNPSRVERIIAGHAAVKEVAVYGVDAVGGDEVWAAVTVSAPCPAEVIIAHCHGQLAPYEVPYRLLVLDRLPRNGMGKVDRGRLPRRT